MKPLRLRPHHFLCILTYAGAGYTPRFVRGFDAVVKEVRRGRPVRIVAGPDDICAGLTGRRFQRHCHSKGVKRRDSGALADFRRAAPELFSPLVLTRMRLARLRRLYAAGRTRTGCSACGWKSLCDRLVVEQFAPCRL